MSPLLKNLVTALGITVLVAVVYYALPSDDLQVVVDDGTNVAQGIAAESASLLQNKQKLESINLDKKLEFFNDKRFTSLQNTRIELKDQNTGRGNPFEPVQ